MEGKLWEVDAFLVGKTFFVGEKVSVADFAMYHPIKWHKELDSEINPVQKVCPCPSGNALGIWISGCKR